MFSHREIIAVNQDRLGKQGKRIAKVKRNYVVGPCVF